MLQCHFIAHSILAHSANTSTHSNTIRVPLVAKYLDKEKSKNPSK